MISIRQHCIPAYNELRHMEAIKPLPVELSQMDEKTAGGIIKKLFAVINSEYFMSLPETAIIQSGGNTSYNWHKSDAKKEALCIYNECVEYLT